MDFSIRKQLWTVKSYSTVSGVEDPPARFLKRMSELQPPARGIQCLSKWRRLCLGNEKQHISKNGSISKQNQKRPEQVKNIVDFVNKLFLKEYTEILVHCCCDVCLRGLFKITDSDWV